jgi:hypothetical protein
MNENAPPGQGKGSVSLHSDEALISPHRQRNSQVKVDSTEEVVSDQNTVKIFDGIGGEK